MIDCYDSHAWVVNCKACYILAISEIRLWGLITGEYEPIAGERDWRWS